MHLTTSPHADTTSPRPGHHTRLASRPRGRPEPRRRYYFPGLLPDIARRPGRSRREQLVGSLSLADRSGDLILRAICLSNLAAVALPRHDNDAVRFLAPGAKLQVRPSIQQRKSAKPRHVAPVAWQDGRPEDVVVLANEAGELFRPHSAPGTKCCK